jgi:hypothetical protein
VWKNYSKILLKISFANKCTFKIYERNWKF